ncbi:MAG TPA: hypothetical protein VM452_18420 [Caulifigura sp.]|nr:hypothetical protein [Caulifigura sp.]
MRPLVAFLACFIASSVPAAEQPKPFRIRIVDESTGRGIPLVELVTTNHAAWVSDSAGQVAYDEPEQFGGDVFFSVKCQGYEPPKAPFGYEGVRLSPKAGGEATIKLKRKNIAERLCRLTGAGRYRDSVMLGDQFPDGDKVTRGGVVGQDSIQAAIYRGKQYWFWGDTSRAAFPLGLFRTAGATSPLFVAGKDSLDRGIAYDYFTDSTGFARAMIPYPEQKDGVIWISGVTVVPDAKGNERMACRYSRRKGLAEQLEQGIAVFDDEQQIFIPVTQQPLDEKWRFIDSHPVVVEEDGKRWLMWGDAAANARVPATFEAICDPKQYEAFTCLKAGAGTRDAEVERTPDGTLNWRWDKGSTPVTPEIEHRLLRSGTIKVEGMRLSPAAPADNGRRIRTAFGTVRFNKHRNCWILISGQHNGSSSFLGEVWYSEGHSPTGPFANAVKIVTHDGQSFYNVCQHDSLDEQGGRIVYFEGTYTNSFTKNVAPTPRYEYNQVLYRLDLDAEALKAARP